MGLDAPSTWEGLIKGISAVDYITAFDTEGFETRIAAEVKGFDPLDYLDRKEARRLDRFAQFAIVASREALSQARLSEDRVDPYRTAVIVGSGIGGIITLSQQQEVLREKGPRRVSPFLIPMMLADMGPAQISMALGAMGPNFCTVSSCSSGADAIGQAWEMVRRGDVDIAIAGGSEAPICPIAIAGFGALRALSRHNEEPKKASRPFDALRDGFVMGEGAAILVLESHQSVLRRGVEPLAELSGYAATSDAFHITEPAPDGSGAAKAMQLAIQRAGLEPTEIDYINAHGTSTPLNDRHETLAIKTAFGEEAYKVAISSTKSMTGHLLGAAGALEAAICVLAIQHQAIPPTINLENPDPECDLDYTPNTARRSRVRAAMSNAFGFGGHNSVLIFTAADHI
jgi:3-oxoacyl-[acyl-carrier-protein] synthase II